MKILFLHGWNSVVGGVKPTYLTTHGHEVVNPALPHEDFAAAVRIAQSEFDRHLPQVVVGSSRGGAIAMNIDSRNARLVLLCPAWRKYGTAKAVKAGTVLLHGRDDDVVAYADSEELALNSGATLIEVGRDHRLADPEPLAAMLRACEDRPPIFCGIDISSDTSKCAIAIGEASGGSDGPTLHVTPWNAPDRGGNDWTLPTVAGLLRELGARCRAERRKAVVAVDIPFGYPKAFGPYLEKHPLQTKGITDRLTLVDDLLFRGCEKQLKRTLLEPESWTTTASRLPLWKHYQSLQRAFFSDDDPKQKEKRNKDGSVKASSGFTTTPLCTVADKIGRAVARWIRVACELGARSVGPSVWTFDGSVYLFECYPLATIVSSGLWHPDLKSPKRGYLTRAAAVDLLRGQRIPLAGSDDEGMQRDCGASWGNVQVGDVTGSDHTFDAFVCTCTAWWCGSSLLSRHGVPEFGTYPRPPLAEVSVNCFTDPAGEPLEVSEGGIYYPRTPQCLVES